MEKFETISKFHGHMCPGLALGYRASQHALERLGQRAVDEELVAIVENNSCAVDAVQVMTGCTFGKGNLVFRDYGKQVYTFIARGSGQTVRISVKWTGPEESEEEKDAWRRYSGGDRSEEVQKIVHSRKSRKIQAILNAPDEELFDVKLDPVAPPHEARIFTSLICDGCGEKTMETRMRLYRGDRLCIPCFDARQNAKE